jgi:hypothetical protein
MLADKQSSKESLSSYEAKEGVSPLPLSPARTREQSKSNLTPSSGLSFHLLEVPKQKKVPNRKKSSGINYFLNSVKFEQEI